MTDECASAIGDDSNVWTGLPSYIVSTPTTELYQVSVVYIGKSNPFLTTPITVS